MRLQGIRAGDLVLCDVKGRRFHAEVTTTPSGAELEIRPLLRAIKPQQRWPWPDTWAALP